MYAFQNHIDLDYLKKPELSPSDFEEGAFLAKNGRLRSVNIVASTLAEKSGFLKDFIIYKDSDVCHLNLDEHDLSSEHLTQHINIYIKDLGIYALCKKSSLVFMILKLFFDLNLHKKIKHKPVNTNDELTLSSSTHNKLHCYLNLEKDEEMLQCLYFYACSVVRELDEFSTYKHINPHVYRFRNSVQKHAFFDDSHPWDRYGSYFYFNTDYSDDLELLEPSYYDCVYINTEGYFYMPHDIQNDSSLIDVIETI